MIGVGWGGDAVALALGADVPDAIVDGRELALGSVDASGEAQAATISPTPTTAAADRPARRDAPSPQRST